MEKNDLISVVVPVYNTCNYLEKCIVSLINQTYKNIEIIIIDDGSTDDSRKVIEKYIDIDSRISYYYQENSGPGIARNHGIDKSNGRYITFVDSDDYVEESFVEKLYSTIQDDDVFSICGTIKVALDGTKKYNIVEKKLVDTFRGIATYRRLINKKILLESKIKFSNLKICEDLEFYSKLMIYSNMKYSVVNECLYYYVERKDSLIHTYNKNQDNTLTAVNNVIDFCKNNHLYETLRDELEYLYIAHVIGGYLKRIILDGIDEENFRIIFNEIKLKFPEWYENKYINDSSYIPKIYMEYVKFLRNNELDKAMFYIKSNFR